MSKNRGPQRDGEHTKHAAGADTDALEASSRHSRDDVVEVDVGTRLNREQRELLRQLTRLHLSLRGPQSLLEVAGHFNRPPFPPSHPRSPRDRYDA
jgi:hypothetical protein